MLVVEMLQDAPVLVIFPNAESAVTAQGSRIGVGGGAVGLGSSGRVVAL